VFTQVAMESKRHALPQFVANERRELQEVAALAARLAEVDASNRDEEGSEPAVSAVVRVAVLGYN
jgi:hypothetical protein